MTGFRPGGPADGTVVNPVRIGEAIDLFLIGLRLQGRTPSTRAGYRRDLNHLADEVNDAFVHDIRLED